MFCYTLMCFPLGSAYICDVCVFTHTKNQSINRELHRIAEELGVNICQPSTVKGTRWIPHVHRALKVFLRHGEGKNLATDHGQYSVVLQHMEHLAVAGSVEIGGRAKKVSFTQN